MERIYDLSRSKVSSSKISKNTAHDMYIKDKGNFYLRLYS